MINAAEEELKRRCGKWLRSPETAIRELFGAVPEVWQEKAIRAFGRHDRIAIKSAKGPGKSCLLAWMGLIFLLTRPRANVVCTSISQPNLRDGLWKEFGKWYERSELLKTFFEMQATRIVSKEMGGNWWISARSWSHSADQSMQADTLAGVHEDYILVLLDEVGGIPDGVMASAEGALATGIEKKIVIAGNPTHLSGPLWRAFHTEKELWYPIELTGDPDNPDRASRIDLKWALDQIKKYGKDNPWVRVNVYGDFPPESIDALLGPEEVAEAMRRGCRQEDIDGMQRRMGIDFARFGDDKTVIFKRQGLLAHRPVEMRNANTMEITQKIIAEKMAFGSEIELLDSTGGYGAGPEDMLRAAGYSPFPIHANSKASRDIFFNKRSECFWELAQWVKRGGVLPNDPELAQELTAITYTYQNGKIRVEEKETIKEKIQRSPDFADALSLTFALPEAKAMLTEGWYTPANVVSEWDPMKEKKQDWCPV